ncbi:MAG: LD-carboxypeptidase [Sulfolobales archaeon]
MVIILRTRIKPPKIRSGARVLLIAPSSYPVYPEMNLSMGVEILRKYGFNIVFGDSVRYALRKWYLSAPEEVRVRDLIEGFRREDIDVIWCVRGGAGGLRLLDYIDYDLIARNPKPLIGFSDITALQNALYSRTGLISIHGEMIATTPKLGDEIGLERFKRNLEMVIKILQGETLELRHPEDGAFPKTINPGKTSGEIVGGNLILFTLIQGTPYRVNTENKIVFLEDIREDAWRIDNYLTTLALGEHLQKASGVIFGEFPEPEAKTPAPSIEEVIIDRARRYIKTPSFLNFPCCHGGDEHGHYVYPLAIGSRITMDADEGVVYMEEPAVE